jgi:adenylate kinase family enzyme
MKLKIVVIGTSCSGKTTLAQNLSKELNITHIELDSLYWKPKWESTPIDEFKASVMDSLQSNDQWVVDGNYSKVRDIIWKEATTIIWLNYPFYLVFFRALKRTISRAITKEPMFSGNVETFKQSFLSKDSILLWVITTYNRRKKKYPLLFMKPEYRHLKVIELKKQKSLKEIILEIQNNI